MHHPAEQYCGRGIRDSTPLDVQNRGPWPPIGSRGWAPPPWGPGTVPQSQHPPHPPLRRVIGPNHPNKFYNQGPSARGRDKPEPEQAIGQALPWEQRQPRPWEQQGQQPGPAHPHQEYNTRPGGPAPTRPHQLQRGQYGGPHYPRPRAPPPMGEGWNHTHHQSRGFPGKKMGAPRKRPVTPHGEHSLSQQSRPPRHARPPEDCAGPKRKRRSSSEQIPNPGTQRFFPLEHSQ
ncbi:hypothetical protein AAFF_G00291080, partial [Aldrovandia affinis]